MNEKSQFETLVSSASYVLEKYLEDGGDPDLVDVEEGAFSEGATLLFCAVLNANLDHVNILVRNGCNVNYRIGEEYSSSAVLAETPLSLAEQCAFLMDKEKYDPIIRVLLESGAT